MGNEFESSVSDHMWLVDKILMITILLVIVLLFVRKHETQVNVAMLKKKILLIFIFEERLDILILIYQRKY